MPFYQLSDQHVFPPIDHAEPDGLLAIGGDLSSERLILAYESGIFPWFSEDQPILWWSPNPRFILWTSEIHISRSMKRSLNSNLFNFTVNKAFEKVINQCGTVPRIGQDGTWITEAMKEAYIELHKKGSAWSFETWKGEKLIGGMYGVKCENYFAGESMFSLESNASKFALIKACKYLSDLGIDLLDCQMHSLHLESMGAKYIEREDFKKFLTIKTELR